MMDDLLKQLRAAGLNPIVIDENFVFPIKRPSRSIEILHKLDSNFFTVSSEGNFQLVAVLAIPEDDVPSMLEDAFRITNHIETDWTENPEVVRSWGPCRSSSVGDAFIVDGEVYLVDHCGFKKA